MHQIFVEYELSEKELRNDLKEVFENKDFFFPTDRDRSGTLVELVESDSYLKRQIEIWMDEEEGFQSADLLAIHLTKKYKCDVVRELSASLAIREFGNDSAAQVSSVLLRNNRAYVIADSDGENEIQEEGFIPVIEKEITNYNRTYTQC